MSRPIINCISSVFALGQISAVQAAFEVIYVPIMLNDFAIIVPTYNQDVDGDGIVDYDDPTLSPEQAFNAFGNALVAGNVDASVRFLAPGKRERYREAFSNLGSDDSDVMKGITKTVLLSSSATRAEIGVNRVVNGELRAFIVSLVKDRDGVWRISEL